MAIPTPNLDYRDIRASDVSVGDLLDYDALMRRLPEQDQVTINRKIAHVTRSEGRSVRVATLEEENDSLAEAVAGARAERETAKAETTRLLGQVVDLEQKLEELRTSMANREAQHEREVQEAEVRGFQRGREEATAA